MNYTNSTMSSFQSSSSQQNKNGSNTYNSNYRFVNGIGMLKFMVGFSVILGLIVHIGLMFLLVNVLFLNTNLIDKSQVKLFTDMKSFYGDFIFIGVMAIVYSFVKTIIFSFNLWKFVGRRSEEEIIKNKWYLILLSLSMGGIFIPFMIMRYFPNTDLSGTMRHKTFIGRTFGLSWLISSVLATIFILAATFKNGGFHNLSSVNGEMFVCYGLLAISFIFSLITTTVFYNKNIENALASKTTLGKIANGLSYILLVIVTIQLIIRMVSAIIQLFESLARIFQERNFFEIFLALMFEMFRAIAVIYLVNIIYETIKALWRAQRSGEYVQFHRINTFAAKTYEERLISRQRAAL